LTSPLDPSTGIFGTDDGRLRKTADGGVTYSDLRAYYGPVFSSGYDRRIRTVNFVTNDPRVVFASGAEGVLRSVDRGNTWSVVDAGPTERLAVDRTGSTILALRRTDARYSTDGGTTWRTLGGHRGYSVAWSPVENGVFFTASQNLVSAEFTPIWSYVAKRNISKVSGSCRSVMNFAKELVLVPFKRNSGRHWRSAVATTNSDAGMPGRMVRSQEPKELQTSEGNAAAK